MISVNFCLLSFFNFRPAPCRQFLLHALRPQLPETARKSRQHPCRRRRGTFSLHRARLRQKLFAKAPFAAPPARRVHRDRTAISVSRLSDQISAQVPFGPPCGQQARRGPKGAVEGAQTGRTGGGKCGRRESDPCVERQPVFRGRVDDEAGAAVGRFPAKHGGVRPEVQHADGHASDIPEFEVVVRQLCDE